MKVLVHAMITGDLSQQRALRRYGCPAPIHTCETDTVARVGPVVLAGLIARLGLTLFTLRRLTVARVMADRVDEPDSAGMISRPAPGEQRRPLNAPRRSSRLFVHPGHADNAGAKRLGFSLG